MAKKLTQQQIKEVKGQGFLINRGTEQFPDESFQKERHSLLKI